MKESPITTSMMKRRRMRLRTRCGVSLLCFSMVQPISAFVKPIALTQRGPARRQLHRHHYRSIVTRTTTTLQSMSTAASSLPPPLPPRPHLAVALDKPLIPSDPLFYAPKQRWGLFQALASLLPSNNNVVQLTAITLAASLLLLVILRTDALRRFALYTMGKVSAAMDHIRGTTTRGGRSRSTKGTPMYFDATENEGWGVCTLLAKRRLGKTNFAQYDFELPDPETYLDLDLGQQVSMCCLDTGSSVAKGEFYVYHPDRYSKPGTFSILAPNKTPQENRLAVGFETANLVRVLKQDVKVGDEVALKPGARKLDYRGQYLPVVDMVYIAHGTGIVPVLEQIRAVLPSGSSSVKSVAVAWINEETKDFDVNADLLEKEYYRYRKKMAVSCIVENVNESAVRDSAEINAAVPSFQPGTMAIVSGPEAFAEKTVEYLWERGYPRDTICVL